MSEETEIAFVDELRKHENQWVAIHESGETEIIVGTGSNAVEATREAETKGFYDTVLYKVLPLDKGYVPGGRNLAQLVF
jgi:threonine dehydratase